MGGLRTSMATCGYQDIAEFNRAELMIAPALQTEGKQLQRDAGRRHGLARRGGRAPRPTPTTPARRQTPARRSTSTHDATGLVTAVDRGDRARRRVGAASTRRGGRRGRRPRLRRAVLAADRAPRARVRRLLASCCRTTSAPRRSRRRKPKGLILSGGPASVYADGAPQLDPELLELGIPVLGICYGMQLLALDARRQGRGRRGRRVRPLAADRRASRAACSPGCPPSRRCWMSHRDTVFEAPPGFTALASSTESPVAAFEYVERGIYGIQFHPEVVHTPYGQHDPHDASSSDICGCDMHVDRRRRSSRSRSRASAPRSATARSSAASPAASTRRSPRCSCTARSATS